MIRNLPALFIFLSLFLISCTTAPITGRGQLILLSEYQEIQLGLTAYNQALKENKLSTNKAYIDSVRQVGTRIGPVTGKNYNWEFNVIESDVINAWCLPGGKIAFYEGILDIMDNEAQIAAVMGHEIAHATARHGGERISLGILAQVGAVALQIAMRKKDSAIQYAVFQAYAPTVLIGVILPYSRLQESEADQIGLIYMARAGYNPEEAVTFWEIMYETNKGKPRPPEWLSTHPPTPKRIQAMREFLPEAMEIYLASEDKKIPVRQLH
jgi:predicted Zn-dependent protease